MNRLTRQQLKFIYLKLKMDALQFGQMEVVKDFRDYTAIYSSDTDVLEVIYE